MYTRRFRMRTMGDTARPVTCEEAGCIHFAQGWVTKVDEATPLGQKQAAYIRGGSDRKYHESREGTLTVFVFPAKQRCFSTHTQRVPVAQRHLIFAQAGNRTPSVILDDEDPTEWRDQLRSATDPDLEGA